ncbi:MAG TPA: hypothetical protein VHE14_07880 [Solirubrobacteraceae bacterium]|nr:hypothetical protein [Solirubrobacteraceae bacterium]
MPFEDPGQPISYLVLEPGTPVFAEGGVVVGKVKRVVADRGDDIFEGLVIHTHDGDRNVAADQLGALHEHAVALEITAEECAQLPRPGADSAGAHGDAGEPPGEPLHKLEDMARHAWERISGKH